MTRPAGGQVRAGSGAGLRGRWRFLRRTAGPAAEAAKRPALKAVETAPEAPRRPPAGDRAGGGREAARRARRPRPARRSRRRPAKRAAPPRTLATAPPLRGAGQLPPPRAPAARGHGRLSLLPRRGRVPFRRLLLDPLGGARRGGGGDPRRHHRDRRRRQRRRSPTSSSSTSAARRSSRRSTREIDLRAIYNRKPDDWVFSLGEDATIEDLLRALEPDGGRELREPLRHHPGARHRLHPRGRAGDHPGDPGEVDRAGEPPGRAGAHRRDPLRQGRPRRGRGAPARPAPGARELPPRAPDGRSRRPTWRGRWGSSPRCRASSPRRWSSATCCSPTPSRPTSGCSRRTGGSPPSPTASRTSAPPSAPPAPTGKMPEVVGDFEALKVDLEFASQAYTQALANLAARPRRGAAAVALPRGARGADARRELALSPPGAALGAGRALPPARLGRR